MKNRVAIIPVLLFLCAALLSSCSLGAAKVKTVPFSNSVNQTAYPDALYHTSSAERLQLCASSEAAGLFFDETTFNFAYGDDFSDKMWSALPENRNTLASVLSAVLISADGRFYLDSQDNSVAFGTAYAEEKNDGLRLTYIMAPDKQTAEKNTDELTDGELYLKISVDLAVEDGRLSVMIDCGDIFVSDGFVLEKLSVLPYFGTEAYPEGIFPRSGEETDATEQTSTDASEDEKEPEVISPVVSNNTEEDYLVVPDGCGALIYTDLPSVTGTNLSFPVHTGDGVNSPYVPAGVYGIKNGSSAYVCAVTQGDAAASVRAVNFSNEGSVFNSVYAEFLITDTLVSKDKVYCGKSYTGNIELIYKFLSGSSADYVSMAIASGEELIRAGILPGSTISDTVVPLNVSLICSADGKRDTVVTDYEQAEDLLSILKAKGVNSANILLQGAFSGGLSKKTYSALRPLSYLGGSSAFEGLCGYAAKQSFDLYAGVNILSSGKSRGARGLDGSRTVSHIKNPLYPNVGERSYQTYLLGAEKLENGTLSILSSADRLSLTGICVNDSAKNIYEDTGSSTDRVGVERLIDLQLEAIASGKKLAVNGADLGAVKNASLITSIPFDAFYDNGENADYEEIPFFPIMLHGSVIYSGSPANTQSAPYLYLLKTVEYGGAPFFEWTCTDNNPLYYENTLSDAVDFISLMNEKLSDLLSEPVSGHKKLRDGVFRTVYENGAVVIVNYNNYSVIVNGISVSPYSFLRLN